MGSSFLGIPEQRCVIIACVGFVASGCLLAVWAGMSRWHWFVRAMAVVLAAGIFLPIRAYEPSLLLLISGPLIAGLLAAIRRWSAPSRFVPLSAQTAPVGCDVVCVLVALFAGGVLTLQVIELLRGTVPAYGMPAWYDVLLVAAIIWPLATVGLLSCRDRWWIGRSSLISRSDEAPRRSASFGLRNLLLSVAIVAAASLIMSVGLNRPLLIDWRGVIGTAACLVVLTLSASGAALSVRRRPIVWCMVPIAVGMTTAAHQWLIPDGFAMSSVMWPVAGQGLTWTLAFSASLFVLMILVPTYLMRKAGWLGFADEHQKTMPTTRGVAAVSAVVVLLAFVTPIAVIYSRMLSPFPPLNVVLPEENVYPKLIELARQISKLNRNEATLAELQGDGIDDRATRLAAIYASLHAELGRPAHVPLDLDSGLTQQYFAAQVPDMQAVRTVARVWDRESAGAATRGRYDEAADYSLGIVKLGSKCSIGGPLMHSLVGVAMESIGTTRLSKIRNDISVDRARALLRDLENIERDREPPEIALRREQLLGDRTYTWRYRVSEHAPEVLANAEDFRANQAARQATDQAKGRRDAFMRLLKTELAIRLYQADHGRNPRSLEELVPDYLADVPDDPFSGEPLVYMLSDNPQAGSQFRLYSVGRDGTDNGGQFGDVMSTFNSGDWDVDTQWRPPAPKRKVARPPGN